MTNRIHTLLHLLLNPHARVTDPEKIQRSRLLSTILLVMIVLGVTILSFVIYLDPEDIREPEAQGALLVLGIVTVMYIVNRMGFNRYAAAGVILPFIIIFTYIAFSASGKSIFLAFVLIPILLTAIFFSLRWTAIFSVSMLALIFLLLSFQDQVSPLSPFWSLRNMWFFLMLSTGLVLTFMWHLGNLEEIRQRELRRINEQLEQKVAEMERFSYTVSHELKNPVITIKGYLGSIEKDLQDNNFQRAQKDLLRVSTASDRLHDTISDLLELSRLGRIVNQFEEFELSALIQEALETIDASIRAHNAMIDIAPHLPVIYGDRIRLREVFENLIGNAAKYMGKQESPRIEVGVRDGKEPVFFVKDNGLGIEPHYHTKIFGLFDKLDANSEGTGIGLALVKRIIETHGGKIWVESEGLGKGSTFCFTIPDGRKIA